MKYLKFWAVSSTLLGVGWVLLVYTVQWWTRRAAALKALYG